jgi:hypothetical protein
MSNNNPNIFLCEPNIKMLWEILQDDNIIINKNREEITIINEIFLKIAKEFYDKERNIHENLINMNKKFISVIINILNQKFPKPKSLIIHDDSDLLVTAEEIQTNRINKFEKEFQIKQKEFTNSMSLPIPDKPNFSDNIIDEPITELDDVIKRTIAQRNFEIQEISNNFDKKSVETWLKSSETSVNVEKIKKNQDNFETLKLEKNELTNNFPKKHITWKEELSENIEDSKFKQKNTEEVITKLFIDDKIDNLEKKIDMLYYMIEKFLNKFG